MSSYYQFWKQLCCFIFLAEINTFIKQECIQLVKTNRKGIYNVQNISILFFFELSIKKILETYDSFHKNMKQISTTEWFYCFQHW